MSHLNNLFRPLRRILNLIIIARLALASIDILAFMVDGLGLDFCVFLPAGYGVDEVELFFCDDAVVFLGYRCFLAGDLVDV